jgi:hypothetical protein
MKIKLLLVMMAVLFVGCASVDYLGDSFAPTAQIDVFFDEADIEYEYRVIGRIYASAPSALVSSEKLMEKIKEKAMEHGGEGVIILTFGHIFTGSTTSYSEETKETESGTKTTGKTSTSSEEKKEVEALVIIYEKG